MPNRSFRQVLIRSAAAPKVLSIATYFAERGWIKRLDLAEGAGPVNALVATIWDAGGRVSAIPVGCPADLSCSTCDPFDVVDCVVDARDNGTIYLDQYRETVS